LIRRLTGLPLVCHVRYRVAREFCEWAFGHPGRQPDALLWTSRQQEADCADAIRGIVPAERQQIILLGLDLDTFGTRFETSEATRRAWGFLTGEIVIGQAGVRSRPSVPHRSRWLTTPLTGSSLLKLNCQRDERLVLDE
jgi:hypothetical protein